ncbi:glycosyl transferase family 39 [Fusobacterium sp. CAG:439]|nr:glycosyl transferase family 39 [Fusobacterium sp. CAG:439]
MKKYAGIFGIVILGIILRLIFIDKPDGLWNDEYVSWMIAAAPFNNGFISAVKSQCHMPFYYLYLKFFMTLFGQSDLLLRLTSVFAGILSIIAMYFTGREKDEKTGLTCASLTAISSFLIYYSQEVRLYSVLFLFSALSLLYTLRCIKNPVKKNFALCALFNFLILFTHTIGFVFVFFNLIFLSINLYKQFKKVILTVWLTIFAGGIILSPLILKILTTQSFSQWWGHFSISKLGFLFTDYFSPVLTNLTNAPDKFLYAPKLAFFMLVPTLIATVCIIKSLIKNKFNIELFAIFAGTVLVLVTASLTGKLVFITKYSIEIYPILIFLACSGLTSINNKIIKNSLIIIYCFISVGYIILHPYSAPKMRRAEGHKIMTDILTRMDLKKDDIILLEYYPQTRFQKYFDFSPYRVVEIHKGNFPMYLSPSRTYEDAYKNGKTIYKSVFSSKQNTYFQSMLNNQIFNRMENGQSVVMAVLNSVSFYSPQSMEKITADENLYNKEPLLFLVFSYVKNKTFAEMLEKLAIVKFEQKGNWTLIKFTKLNNNKEN